MLVSVGGALRHAATSIMPSPARVPGLVVAPGVGALAGRRTGMLEFPPGPLGPLSLVPLSHSMRRAFFACWHCVLPVAALCATACQPSEPAGDVDNARLPAAVRLDSDERRQSYALGYHLAGNLSQQSAPLDSAAFRAGIADRLAQAASKLSESDRLAALEVYQQRTQGGQSGQSGAGDAAQNRAASEKYLAENAKRSEVAVTKSGLQYEVLQLADGPTPGPRDRVRVHYRGELVDGTEFDSSHRRGEPIVFRVNQVIAGWQEALQMMPVGSRWRLVIPSNLAYGSRGPGQIGPDSALVFEVELLEVLSEER